MLEIDQTVNAGKIVIANDRIGRRERQTADEMEQMKDVWSIANQDGSRSQEWTVRHVQGREAQLKTFSDVRTMVT